MKIVNVVILLISLQLSGCSGHVEAQPFTVAYGNFPTLNASITRLSHNVTAVTTYAESRVILPDYGSFQAVTYVQPKTTIYYRDPPFYPGYAWKYWYRGSNSVFFVGSDGRHYRYVYRYPTNYRVPVRQYAPRHSYGHRGDSRGSHGNRQHRQHDQGLERRRR